MNTERMVLYSAGLVERYQTKNCASLIYGIDAISRSQIEGAGYI